MSISIRDIDYSQLSLGERTVLLHDLIESIRTEADAHALTPEFRAELERRLAEMKTGDVSPLSWEEIRSAVFGQP